MPYRVIAQEALARWRDAERRRERSEPGSANHLAAQQDAEQARRDYQDAIEAAMRAHLPVPIAFDEAVGSEPKTDMSANGDDGQDFGAATVSPDLGSPIVNPE